MLAWALLPSYAQAIAEGCQRELARLPTSAAEDESLLRAPQEPPPLARLAIEFRLGKKRLLERCLAQVAKNLKRGAAPAERVLLIS
jgi:hypothetical protein